MKETDIVKTYDKFFTNPNLISEEKDVKKLRCSLEYAIDTVVEYSKATMFYANGSASLEEENAVFCDEILALEKENASLNEQIDYLEGKI